MKITRIVVENFKSFQKLDLRLNSFNLLIGANASGKSNFIEILNFLRNVESLGLENAYSMEGGEEYFFNLGSGILRTKISISLQVVNQGHHFWGLLETAPFVQVHRIDYATEIAISPETGEPYFESEVLSFDFLPLDLANRSIQFDFADDKKSAFASLVFNRTGNKIKAEVKPYPGLEVQKRNLNAPPFGGAQLGRFDSILGSPNVLFLLSEKIFSSLAIYDFDVKQIKTAAKISARAELEENGSNLPIVLKNLLVEKSNKQRFSNLLRDFLPFITDIDVQTYVDRSLMFKVCEIYSPGSYLPSPLLSDGTINVTALILALYFENKAVLFFEEPEGNLHPALIKKMTSHMKSRSEAKQILVSTHNPEVIRGADVKDVLFVSRAVNGASVINRLDMRNDICTFLENEIGLDELYAQNLL